MTQISDNHLLAVCAGSSALFSLLFHLSKETLSRERSFGFFHNNDNNDRKRTNANESKYGQPRSRRRYGTGTREDEDDHAGAMHTRENVWDVVWHSFSMEQEDKHLSKQIPLQNETDRSQPTGDSIDERAQEAMSKPLLWLQGLNMAARRQLLGLVLALLEENMKDMEAQGAIKVATASEGSFKRLCIRLMARCSLQAAVLWLGYMPSALEESCYAFCGSETIGRDSILSNFHRGYVGIRRAHSDYSSSEILSEKGGISRSLYGKRCGGPPYCIGQGTEDRKKAFVKTRGDEPEAKRAETKNAADDQAVRYAGGTSSGEDSIPHMWYGFEERMSLYCSVMRLLWSLENGNGNSNSFTTAEEMRSSHKGFHHAVKKQDRHDIPNAWHGENIKSSAPSPTISGWKATSGGVKSSSQLLDMAPCVIQDMAILVADAIAEAYLLEAVRGQTWSRMHAGQRGLENLMASEIEASDVLEDPIEENATEKHKDNAQLRFSYKNQAQKIMGIDTQPSGVDEAESMDMHRIRVTYVDDAPSNSKASKNAGVTREEPNEMDTVPGMRGTINNIAKVRYFRTIQREVIDSSNSRSLEVSWWPMFAHPRLSSTRQLQRFSNRLIGCRWLDRNFYGISAMYEDRLPIFTLAPVGPLLRIRRVPVKRASELERLRGIPYAASLLLEISDIVVPIILYTVKYLMRALAWILKRGIGRALGLIWRGIRDAVVGNEKERRRRGEDDGGRSSGPAKQHASFDLGYGTT